MRYALIAAAPVVLLAVAVILVIRAATPSAPTRSLGSCGLGPDCTSLDTQMFSVTVGMSRRSVDALRGVVWLAGPHCTSYRVEKKGTSIDGLRFCFTNGLVSRIQTSIHG